MAIIMLPNYCFKTKYQEDLDQMKAAGYQSVELDFSKEEIQEIRQMQIQYEKRKQKERKTQAYQKDQRKEVKEQAEMLQEFWNDPKRTKLD